jgi:hypothetical protein
MMRWYELVAMSVVAIVALSVSAVFYRSVFLATASLGESIRGVEQAIRLQTAQQSWLVEHYARPVRLLYPSEKHRCEWCGAEKPEGEGAKVTHRDTLTPPSE